MVYEAGVSRLALTGSAGLAFAEPELFMGNDSPVTLARLAMATRFEIVLHGPNPVSLRAAGEEALTEIERWEDQLSLYRPTSEIAHLNARAGREWVRVSPAVFQLLRRAQHLSEESGGAFDITVGPLIRCWGFMGASGSMPDPAAVAEARAKVGMHLVQFNEAESSIHFARDGVMLDLGAIGKGHAIECAAELLREAGVSSALIHGGTSSVQAIGHPPDSDAWNVAIEYPDERKRGAPTTLPLPVRNERGEGRGEGRLIANEPAQPQSNRPSSPLPSPPAAGGEGEASGALDTSSRHTRPALLAVVPLRDEAMSVSAVWGKSFQSEGRTLGHVLDPRTGQPALGAWLAAVVLPSATETDALSTALLALGLGGHGQITGLRRGMKSLVLGRASNEMDCRILTNGITLEQKPLSAGGRPITAEKEN